MSDHASEQEPEKDRTFTAVLVIGVALTLALGVWKDGQAAPNPRPNPKLMKERLGGVKELRFKGQKGKILGVVLERGGSRLVVCADGTEFVIPRSTELEIVDEKAAVKKRPPRKASGPSMKPSTKRKAKRTQGAGFVVNREGEPFKGLLTVKGDRILVKRGNGEEVEIPLQDVRWHKFGVRAPDQSYWAKFPNDPVKGYPGPGQGNELRSLAEIAHAGGDWAQATRSYLNLYLSGEKDEANLRNCAYRWTRTGSTKGPSRDRDQAVLALCSLFKKHLKANPFLVLIQARVLKDVASDCARTRFRAKAIEYAMRLRALGPDHHAAAQKILDRAR
ncbi:MAG: hypothetical protein JKY65_15705 [Planctomycetes bacterium]|nr:hypothetical protein [Planctomycetota bacterium]